MTDLLEGKVAVVTGAGRGIGRATALRFASEGASVVVNDVDGASAASAAEEIIRRGGEAVPIGNNVTRRSDVDAAVDLATTNWGRIAVLHNNAALAAAADRGAYGIAKAGLVQLTRSTAVEYGRYGVRANAICPGPIQTPAFERFAPDPDYYAGQIPMKRLGSPDEVASVAVFLASELSAYVSGVTVSVDGAMAARPAAPYLVPEQVTR